MTARAKRGWPTSCAAGIRIRLSMRRICVGRSMSDTAMNETADDQNRQQRDQSAPVLPGIQLRERRQALGWTVEHVANQLNLAPRQIEAIETDNYAALPGIASIRGFIRAYAKLLKVDASPLIAMIAGEVTTAVDTMPLRHVVPSKPISGD